MDGENEDVAQRYANAAYAYGEGKFEEALAGFLQLAELGNAMAAAYLGLMYIDGEGVSNDAEQGLEWLARAASWGDCTAAYNLGVFYRAGRRGIRKDDDKSKQYFRLAKELGTELSVEKFL